MRTENETPQAQSPLTDQAEAQNRALILETANRVALDILSSRTGEEALRHIAEAARVLAGARYAALGVARPITARMLKENGPMQELDQFITVGITPSQANALGALPRGRGVLGLLLTRTEPLRIDVLAEHPASVGFPPHHPPMDSFLGVPIRRGDTILGSLYLTNKQGGGTFTEADEIAVRALGAYAAVAIHSLQMLSRQHALVRNLIRAQEEERRAVAHDLHDGLTQYVMGAHAHLEGFRSAQRDGKGEKADREIELALKYLKQAVIESRRLVNGLRSLALDGLGLVGALEQLLAEEKVHADWEHAAFLHNIAEQRFDKMLETAVYRVAQEALTNVRKHANTTRVRLLLQVEDNSQTNAPQLRLEVRDWGRGFEPEHQANERDHFGLQGMMERVRLLGGAYELRSAPGQGTTIETVFPALAPQVEREVEINE
jgi:signal transduction histidine kinase